MADLGSVIASNAGSAPVTNTFNPSPGQTVGWNNDGGSTDVSSNEAQDTPNNQNDLSDFGKALFDYEDDSINEDSEVLENENETPGEENESTETESERLYREKLEALEQENLSFKDRERQAQIEAERRNGNPYAGLDEPVINYINQNVEPLIQSFSNATHDGVMQHLEQGFVQTLHPILQQLEAGEFVDPDMAIHAIKQMAGILHKVPSEVKSILEQSQRFFASKIADENWKGSIQHHRNSVEEAATEAHLLSLFMSEASSRGITESDERLDYVHTTANRLIERQGLEATEAINQAWAGYDKLFGHAVKDAKQKELQRRHTSAFASSNKGAYSPDLPPGDPSSWDTKTLKRAIAQGLVEVTN